jgi:hypothetical protein
LGRRGPSKYIGVAVDQDHQLQHRLSRARLVARSARKRGRLAMTIQDAKRVDETLKFMSTNMAGNLSWSIGRTLDADAQAKAAAGAYIALPAGGALTGDRLLALQGLLLCRYVFIEARRLGRVSDWGAAGFGSKDDLLNFWKGKSVAEIAGGVQSYGTARNPGCIAGALESLGRNPSKTDFKYYDMSRRLHKGLGTKAAICYQSICLGLWMSGYASIGWLATWYSASNAANCFDLLGDGDEITDMQRIVDLRGTVISFRNKTKMGAQYVNHWAVITGGGRAIGSNTDGFKDARTVRLSRGQREFIWGDRNFQAFDILECYAACAENTKYKDAGGVRVAIHDPSNMTLW